MFIVLALKACHACSHVMFDWWPEGCVFDSQWWLETIRATWTLLWALTFQIPATPCCSSPSLCNGKYEGRTGLRKMNTTVHNMAGGYMLLTGSGKGSAMYRATDLRMSNWSMVMWLCCEYSNTLTLFFSLRVGVVHVACYLRVAGWYYVICHGLF